MRHSCSTWLLPVVLLPALASADPSVTVASPFIKEARASDGVGSKLSLRQGAAPTDDALGDDFLVEICVEEETTFYECLANEACDEDCQDAGFDDVGAGDDDGSVFNTLDYTDPGAITEVVNTYLETGCGNLKTNTCEAKQCCPQCAAEIDAYYTCLYKTSNTALVAQFEEIEVPTIECSLAEVTCDENGGPPGDGPGGPPENNPGDGAGPGENGPPGQNQTVPGNGVGPGGMPAGQNETIPGNGVGPGGMPPGQNETIPGNGVGPGGIPPPLNGTTPAGGSNGAGPGNDVEDDDGGDDDDDDEFGLEIPCEDEESALEDCLISNDCQKCEEELNGEVDDDDSIPSSLENADLSDPDSVTAGFTTYLEDACVSTKPEVCSAKECCPKCEAALTAAYTCYFDSVGPGLVAFLSLFGDDDDVSVADLEIPEVDCDFTCTGGGLPQTQPPSLGVGGGLGGNNGTDPTGGESGGIPPEMVCLKSDDLIYMSTILCSVLTPLCVYSVILFCRA